MCGQPALSLRQPPALLSATIRSEHGEERRRVEPLALPDRHGPRRLVVVPAGDDVLRIRHDRAVVEKDVDVVFRREQRADVALEDEVRAISELDRLGDLRVRGVHEVADLAADRLLPLRQRVDVAVHSRVGRVGHDGAPPRVAGGVAMCSRGLGSYAVRGYRPGVRVNSPGMSGGEPTTGPLTSEELQLATRNRGMPLEALRYDITPTGMHYLLVHFDIPHVDPETWRLEIGGNVESPRSLGLGDLRAMPATHAAGDDGVRRQRQSPAHAAAGQPAVAGGGRGHRDVDRGAAAGRPLGGRGPLRTPRSSCSPAPTTACRAGRSRSTSAASRWPKRSVPRCCSPTR